MNFEMWSYLNTVKSLTMQHFRYVLCLQVQMCYITCIISCRASLLSAEIKHNYKHGINTQIKTPHVLYFYTFTFIKFIQNDLFKEYMLWSLIQPIHCDVESI